MLRKRASFKPNLKQASTPSSAPNQISTHNNLTELPSPPDTISNDTNKTVCLTNNPHSSVTDIQEEQQQQVLERQVQAAISELKGQKSEPIKLQSLRNSANKNVKLKDLLFFNPPLTKDQKKHKKNASQAKKVEQKKLIEDGEDPDKEENENGDAAAEQSLVPKVKMGPDGRLILDEGSTLINRKNSLRDQQAIIEDSDDIIGSTNYDSFRRRPANLGQSKWSEADTKRFYQALTLVGTDFSLMECLIFSGVRSRAELHKKFKREERLNKLKIDIALKNRISLSSTELSRLFPSKQEA